VATQGIAVSADGSCVTSSAERICGFGPSSEQARWLRNHSGANLGTELVCHDGLWIASASPRGARAYSSQTGLEVWRVEPPRAHRSYLAHQGSRGVLTTDAGHVSGFRLSDGQVTFKMRAALPFVGPATAWGKKWAVLMNRGERTGLLAIDALSGQILWAVEFALERPSQPLAHGQRIWVAGGAQSQQRLVCLGPKGNTLWSRTLPLQRGPLSLLAVGQSVVATDRTGAAASVSAKGHLDWRLGSAGEALEHDCPPVYVRGVLLVPGERLRAVDPRGGRVLGEFQAGLSLCALVADAKLNLYLLDEMGSLRAYRLTSHFAVL
jgi:outer membrane protein assembly factor BamB